VFLTVSTLLSVAKQRDIAMARFAGFLQLRRGIFEHIRDGRLSHKEFSALVYIISQADTRNGIWIGSAGALSGEIGLPPRTARDLLEKLEDGGYLRRFPVPGRHACYPILVHKYRITTGEHDGEHLNARDSISKDDLRYFPRDHDGELGVERHVEHGAAQKILDTGNRRENPHALSVRASSFQGKDPRRKIEARDLRLIKEAEVRRELRVGAGPELVPNVPGRVERSPEQQAALAEIRRLAGKGVK
jgi:hypothetical protein